MCASIVLTFSLIEWGIRHSPKFQHGGDREPRNEAGLTWKKPADVKRIVVVGDSVTFGDGVKAIETYPYKLQEIVRTHYDPKYQVVNLGIMGINTDQEAMIVTQQNSYFGGSALSFDPDTLILTFYPNDVELVPDPKPRPETIWLPDALHNYIEKHYLSYRFIHRRINRLLAHWGFQQSYPEYFQSFYRTETPEWQRFREYLTFIIETMKQRNIPLVIVIFPSMAQLDKEHPYLDLYTKVSEIGNAHEIHVLNLFPYFQGKDAGELRVSLLNGHPNAKAYEIAAQAIYQALAENNLL